MAVYLIESKADQQKLIDHVGEDTAKLFFSMKDRLKSPENDIYYWLKRRPEDLLFRLWDVKNNKSRKERDEEASKGAELVYNQDGWKVYHITTYPASVKYGKGTKWCIAGSKVWSNGEKGEEYFNQYTSDGVEFYFYIKDGDEKYALADSPTWGYQVFNAEDDDITDSDLSFLPKVDGLPNFSYDDLLDEDGYFHYVGENIPAAIYETVTKVRVDPSVGFIPNHAFAGCTDLKEVEIPEGVQAIYSNAFYMCSSLESINIPDSVEYMGDSVFEDCDSLKSVRLSNTMSVVSPSLFCGCWALESIKLPDSIKAIGVSAFEQSGLKSINIPDGVRVIEDNAFLGCTELSNVVLPASIEKIGKDVFFNCVNSDEVYYKGTRQQWKDVSIGDNDVKIIQMNTGEVLYGEDSEPDYIDKIFDDIDEERRDRYPDDSDFEFQG